MKKVHSQIAFLALMAMSFSSLPGTGLSQTRLATETLSGRITIRQLGDPPPPQKTRILIYEATGTAQYSLQEDKDGRFSVSLPEGYYFVFVANVGLTPYAKTVWLRHGEPIKLTVLLDPDLSVLQDVF